MLPEKLLWELDSVIASLLTLLLWLVLVPTNQLPHVLVSWVQVSLQKRRQELRFFHVFNDCFQVFTTSALLEVSKQCQMSQFAILRKWDSGCWHRKKWKLPWKCWAILLNWDRPTSLQNCQELPNFQRTRSWDILPIDYPLHSVLADKNR